MAFRELATLGPEVIAREIEVANVGAVTARDRPDVPLVGLGGSSDQALGLIEKIVKEAACPVIVLLHAPDPAFVKEASKRGVFAYITDADTNDWQSSIDIVLRRFAEYQARSGVVPSPSVPRASRWNATPSTRQAPSRCCASTRAPPTASSSTSPPRSSTATACFRNSRIGHAEQTFRRLTNATQLQATAFELLDIKPTA